MVMMSINSFMERGLKGFAYRCGVTPNHDKIGAGGGVGVFAALFPVPQGPKGDVKAFGEVLLR
jgi:hypothetical protein